MQSYTMASARDCPPAELLMTESRAELNAGLVVVTGHVPVTSPDVSMEPETDPEPAATAGADDSDCRAHKARRIAAAPASPPPSGKKSFAATSTVPEDPSDALLGGLLLTPLLGCKARNPLEWTHAWAMPGEWAGHDMGQTNLRAGSTLVHVNFPSRLSNPLFARRQLVPEQRDGQQSSLPSIVHAYLGNKVSLGRKLQQWQENGLAPLSLPSLALNKCPRWTHSNGCDFVRGGRFVVKPRVAATRALTPTQVLLLQSLWVPAQRPHKFNTQPPWTSDAQPLRESLQRRLQLELSSSELSIKIGKRSLLRARTGR